MQRYRHTARPPFVPHRDGPYAATRPFNWKGVRLEPGDPVPDEWPEHHLRHLHRQNLIGPKDHVWTKQRQDSWAKKLVDGKRISEARKTRRAERDAARAEDLSVEPEEARSLSNRLAGLFGGGDSDGRPAGHSDSP